MSDSLLPERIRRLRAVLGHERDIRRITDAAIAAWLLNALDTLDSTTGDPNLTFLGLTLRDDWVKQSEKIAEAAAALWLARYALAGGRHGEIAVMPFRKKTQDNLRGFARRVLARLPPDREALREHLHPRNYVNSGETITRTTVISAFNEGDHAGYSFRAHAGDIVTKTWLATPDAKTRETHSLAHYAPENTAIAVDSPFLVGGFHAQVPGDPSLPAREAVNCRCTVLYTVNGKASLVACPSLDPQGADMADVSITVGDPTAAQADTAPLPDGWRGVIAGLDMKTGDNRYLATPPDGVRTRAYPLTFTFQHVSEGTDIPIGNVDRVWTDASAPGLLFGEGSFDLIHGQGATYAGMLRDGMVNTVSITPDQLSVEYQVMNAQGELLDGDISDYVTCGADGFCALKDGFSEVTVFADWRLAGLAMVSIPAYSEARIEPVFGYHPGYPQKDQTDAIVAAVSPHTYKRASFEVKATRPTPMQIDVETRAIYGHLATWDACHMDFPGMCLTAPAAVDGFSRFHQHSARLEDGSLIAVGALTFGEGHESRGSMVASRKHYADVSTIAAKVVATEDQWGVFIAGELVPNFDMALADVVCHAPLSGHWEPDPDLGGELALIAAHAVVTPGFNVRSLVATYSPETGRHALILTSRRARTGADVVDLDAIVAAVEARLDTRTARRAKLAELQSAMGLPEHQQRRRSERVAELKARIGA